MAVAGPVSCWQKPKGHEARSTHAPYCWAICFRLAYSASRTATVGAGAGAERATGAAGDSEFCDSKFCDGEQRVTSRGSDLAGRVRPFHLQSWRCIETWP